MGWEEVCLPGAVMTARGKRGTKGLVVATAHSDMLMKYWHLHGQQHKRQQQWPMHHGQSSHTYTPSLVRLVVSTKDLSFTPHFMRLVV